MDIRLINGIWNSIITDFFGAISDHSGSFGGNSNRSKICNTIWIDFFGERADEVPSYSNGNVNSQGVIDRIAKWYFESVWYEKYDFVEFLSQLELNGLHTSFIKYCNDILRKEMSGYRIIGGKIVQITSEEEFVEIENALDISSKWEPVNVHLKSAIGFLSNRENADFRNSIKESISAVESLCIIITGDKDASLGKALAIIEKKFDIHKALKSAFMAIYGYTSDSGGIRHALLEDDIEVTLEDAKFMLVTCSAFINYLKVKIE